VVLAHLGVRLMFLRCHRCGGVFRAERSGTLWCGEACRMQVVRERRAARADTTKEAT
jgi:uncharacterized C2H2 Zn-finger protein